MRSQGYLDSKQMAGAFQLLRSKTSSGREWLTEYLMGGRAPMSDLMAWNADATRMPVRMHSEYLRKLFLDNDLAEGRFRVEGRPIAISDIRAPIFAVGPSATTLRPGAPCSRFTSSPIPIYFRTSSTSSTLTSFSSRPGSSAVIAISSSCS